MSQESTNAALQYDCTTPWKGSRAWLATPEHNPYDVPGVGETIFEAWLLESTLEGARTIAGFCQHAGTVYSLLPEAGPWGAHNDEYSDSSFDDVWYPTLFADSHYEKQWLLDKYNLDVPLLLDPDEIADKLASIGRDGEGFRAFTALQVTPDTNPYSINGVGTATDEAWILVTEISGECRSELICQARGVVYRLTSEAECYKELDGAFSNDHFTDVWHPAVFAKTPYEKHWLQQTYGLEVPLVLDHDERVGMLAELGYDHRGLKFGYATRVPLAESDKRLTDLAGYAQGWIDYPLDSIELGSVWHLDKDKAPFGRVMDKYAWRPLDDDGDAFRLAVNLGIQIEPTKHEGTTLADSCESVRRDIVLKAAALGHLLSSNKLTSPTLTETTMKHEADNSPTIDASTVSLPSDDIETVYTLTVLAKQYTDEGIEAGGEPDDISEITSREPFTEHELQGIRVKYAGLTPTLNSPADQNYGWFETTSPDEDRLFFEEGIKTYYELHLVEVNNHAPTPADIQAFANTMGIAFRQPLVLTEPDSTITNKSNYSTAEYAP